MCFTDTSAGRIPWIFVRGRWYRIRTDVRSDAMLTTCGKVIFDPISTEIVREILDR